MKLGPYPSTNQIFLIALFLFRCTHVCSYSTTGFQIRDLESNDLRFELDIQAWRTSSIKSGIDKYYSSCDGDFILGGYSVLGTNGTAPSDFQYFQRSYSNLIPHQAIYFTMVLYVIDTWEEGDLIEIYIDSKLFEGWKHSDDSYAFMDFCGTGEVDLGRFIISANMAHSASSLELKIVGKTDEGTENESFGIRDIYISFTNATVTTDAFCGNGVASLYHKECDCRIHQYLESPGVCKPCHDNCESCYGPSASQCFTCKEGYSFDGGSCYQCDVSCATCIGIAADQCSSCKSYYAFFEGNSCIVPSNCASPYALTHGETMCELQCTDYVYWNGTCSSSCNPPLVPRSENGMLYCDYPCFTFDYLLWNGTCANNCPSHYQKEVKGGKNFCNPRCSSSQYFYLPNLECLDSCPSGFVENALTKLCEDCKIPFCDKCSSLEGTKICSDCKKEAIMDVNNVCKECEALEVNYIKSSSKGHQYKLKLFPGACDLSQETVQSLLKSAPENTPNFLSSSFEVTKKSQNVYRVDLILVESITETSYLKIQLDNLRGTMKVPKKLVPSEGLQELSKYTSSAQATLTAVIGTSVAGTLALGAATSLWSLISFQQFIGYFVYINVEYPYQVQLFLSLSKSVSWNILPNPLASLTSKWSSEIADAENELDAEYQPPKKFVDQEVEPFFIENAGTIILINLGLLFLLFIMLLLKKIGYIKNNSFIERVQSKLRWNVIIRTFLENGVPLALAIFLQIYTFSFDQTYMSTCAVLTILSCIYFLMMTGFLLQSLLNSSNDFLEKTETREMIGTLYEGMVLKDTYAKYYHLIILLRGVLLVFVICFLENYPLLQTSSLIYTNIGLIYYLFKEATFENRRLDVINKLKEILILVGEVCILFIQFDVKSELYYNLLGWLVVGAFMTALLVELGYIIILQIVNIKTLYKKVYKLYKSIKKALVAIRFRSRKVINISQEISLQTTNKKSPFPFESPAILNLYKTGNRLFTKLKLQNNKLNNKSVIYRSEIELQNISFPFGMPSVEVVNAEKS